MSAAYPPDPPLSAETLFGGASATETLLRVTDWAGTPLGPVEHWPEPLLAAVRLMLPASTPMMIWWGAEFTQLYNEPLSRLVGDKHPSAIGQRAELSWAEVWPELSPMVTRVVEDGQTASADSMLLLLERHGYLEETYWTFSFSPIVHEREVAGVFIVAADVTASVVGDRRLETVRQLGGVSSSTAGDMEGTCEAAIRVLSRNRQAVPFAAMYLLAPDTGGVRTVAAYGIAEGTEITPAKEFDLADSPALAKAVATGSRGLVTGLRASGAPGSLSPGPLGPLVPDVAVLMPISVGPRSRVDAVAALGVNPYRAVDDVYLTFFQLAGRQLRVALTDSAAYDVERQQLKELQDLDEEKTRFYQNVSHEFRTPLTLILGPLRGVLGDPQLPERHRAALEPVLRAGMRLRKLVENLLEFSRVEAGQAQLRPEPTDLAAYTANLAGMFRSTIEAAGLTFDVDVDACPDVVDVDRDLWAKIVLNLLSNAVKYTPAGAVRLRLAAEGEQAVLQVSDTGVGIPSDQLSAVFDRFTRLPDQGGRSGEGSGIGLALVSALTAAHGGTVDLRSAPGDGSTFTVSIPLTSRTAARQAQEPAVDPDLTAYAAEAAGWLRRPRPRGAGHRSQPADEAPRSGQVGDLLLVEDNADLRGYLQDLLTEDGWAVTAVADVESALAVSPAPDLVLSDVMLPGRSGLDLLQLMRRDTVLRRIPVLLLTAQSGPRDAARALQAGADDYLVKPFDSAELLARVRVHHELRRLRDQERQQAEEKAANLSRALTSNRRIGIAIGILMNARKITAEQAFDLMRTVSQRTNRKLYDVADDVTLTGALPGV